MKHSAFLIFISIVLVIYAGINFYIYRRGWAALTGLGGYRYIVLGIFLFLVLAYPVGRFAESLKCCGFTQALVFIGSFYLGLMVYLFFMILLIDIFRLGNHFIHFFPSFITQNPQRSSHIAALSVAVIAVLTIFFGHINALHPRIRTLEMEINKRAGNLKQLNIVMASDIHLGTVIHNSRLLKIVDKINALDPDIVLFPGDVVDEDVAPLKNQNMEKSFRKIKSRYGVYAITGNHEYIGGVKQAVEYIQTGDITVLQDSVVKVADAFYLIGRKDLMSERMDGGRKKLADIMEGVDHSYPLILMDHQPFHLEVAQRNGIDLQLSGHTHDGQLFPFNLITDLVYELSWGYKQKGSTHYYVSCGVGTWGPPVRVGNRPEIVRIILKFAEN